MALIISSLIFIAAEGAIFYFYIIDCGDLFSGKGDYPVFSVAADAKGYIAIGLSAQGIVAIGLFS